MGEIIGGLIVMALFIGFIMWKNKGKTSQPDDMQRLHEQQYWAEKENDTPDIVSADTDDD